MLTILIGKGKSTLTDGFPSEGRRVIYGAQELVKKIVEIKENSDIKYIVHLENEEQYKKLPAGLKRRSKKFLITF